MRERTIAVVVFGRSAKPVADATVTLDNVPGKFVGTTDTDGYVAFRRVPESLVASHLWVSADGYVEFSAHVDLPAGNKDLVVGPGASVARPGQLYVGAMVPKVTSRPGTVGAEGRNFVDERGTFYPLGQTLFWALRGWKLDRERLKQNLLFVGRHRFDYVRILCEVGWPGNEIDPRWPDFKPLLGELIDYAYDECGLRVELTLFGGRLPVDHLAVTRDVVDVVNAGRNHKVLNLEAANESFNNLPDFELVTRVSRYIREHTPNLVATSSAPDGNSPDELKKIAGVPEVANLATAHLNRKNDTAEWDWRCVRQSWDFKEVGYAISHNEPIGPLSSVAHCGHAIHLAFLRGLGIMNGLGAFVLHNAAGVSGLAETHPVGGFRPANLWEVPGIDAIMQAVRAVDRYLPDRVGDWTHHNSGWPSHPFPPENAFWAEGHDHGIVRSYAVTRDHEFITMPIGIKQYVQFTAIGRCDIEITDPLAGHMEKRALRAGETTRVSPVSMDERGLGALIIKGRFLQTATATA